jgi:hypothetical protein
VLNQETRPTNGSRAARNEPHVAIDVAIEAAVLMRPSDEPARECCVGVALVCSSLLELLVRVTTNRLSPPHSNVTHLLLTIRTSSPIPSP